MTVSQLPGPRIAHWTLLSRAESAGDGHICIEVPSTDPATDHLEDLPCRGAALLVVLSVPALSGCLLGLACDGDSDGDRHDSNTGVAFGLAAVDLTDKGIFQQLLATIGIDGTTEQPAPSLPGGTVQMTCQEGACVALWHEGDGLALGVSIIGVDGVDAAGTSQIADTIGPLVLQTSPKSDGGGTAAALDGFRTRASAGRSVVGGCCRPVVPHRGRHRLRRGPGQEFGNCWAAAWRNGRIVRWPPIRRVRSTCGS